LLGLGWQGGCVGLEGRIQIWYLHADGGDLLGGERGREGVVVRRVTCPMGFFGTLGEGG